jgi:hypothetical protein
VRSVHMFNSSEYIETEGLYNLCTGWKIVSNCCSFSFIYIYIYIYIVLNLFRSMLTLLKLILNAELTRNNIFNIL